MTTLPLALHRTRTATYLNDHLAGATAGVELARRARGSNEDSEYGALLARIAQELEEDRETLREVMRRLDIGTDHLKTSAGWLAEKVGRLKPNGQLTGYSPLSRLIEHEALIIGITGKLALWRSLEQVQPFEPLLDDFDFVGLANRAERQRDELEGQRLHAAVEALQG